jgi:hypothetical protein
VNLTITIRAKSMKWLFSSPLIMLADSFLHLSTTALYQRSLLITYSYHSQKPPPPEMPPRSLSPFTTPPTLRAPSPKIPLYFPLPLRPPQPVPPLSISPSKSPRSAKHLSTTPPSSLLLCSLRNPISCPPVTYPRSLQRKTRFGT